MTENWSVELTRVTYDRVGSLVKLRGLVTLTLVGMLLGGCYYALPRKSRATQQATRGGRTVYDLPWRSLRRGMTSDMVRDLFQAEPRRITVGPVLTFWYFSENYPHRCHVYFDSGTMTVSGWSEPGG